MKNVDAKTQRCAGTQAVYGLHEHDRLCGHPSGRETVWKVCRAFDRSFGIVLGQSAEYEVCSYSKSRGNKRDGEASCMQEAI